MTHIHLQTRGITDLEEWLIMHKKSRVAFLQRNRIKRIKCLESLKHLRELFLQDNDITRIEGLTSLIHLKKLLLARNRIGVVECLPPNLVELHVEEQRLSQGDTLVLDPRALAVVQGSLHHLNVSSDTLSEIGAVGLLINLKVLKATDNILATVSHVVTVIARLPSLAVLDLRGNPLTCHRKYWPSIVLAAHPTLCELDGKQITKENRQFLQYTTTVSHAQKKMGKDNNRFEGKPIEATGMSFDKDVLYVTSKQANEEDNHTAEEAKYILGALRRPEFELVMWRAKQQEEEKSLTERQLPRFLPRPYWRNRNISSQIK